MEASMSRTLNVPIFQENRSNNASTNSVAFIWELGFTVEPQVGSQYLLTGWIYLQGTEPFLMYSQQVTVSKGDTVMLVFNPLPGSQDIPNDSYRGVNVGITNLIGIEPLPNTITVVFCPRNVPEPIIQVVDCAIRPEWIIGVRNIVIVDPDTSIARTSKVAAGDNE